MNVISRNKQLGLNRAINAMDVATVRSLLESLSDYEIEVTKEPETGLVMMTVSDCFDTDFHLGEVLVTVAEVKIGTTRGWGMIMGDNCDRALLLACLDVVMADDSLGVKAEIEFELERWNNLAEKTIIDEQKRAATTRVSFQSMATE